MKPSTYLQVCPSRPCLLRRPSPEKGGLASSPSRASPPTPSQRGVGFEASSKNDEAPRRKSGGGRAIGKHLFDPPKPSQRGTEAGKVGGDERGCFSQRAEPPERRGFAGVAPPGAGAEILGGIRLRAPSVGEKGAPPRVSGLPFAWKGARRPPLLGGANVPQTIPAFAGVASEGPGRDASTFGGNRWDFSRGERGSPPSGERPIPHPRGSQKTSASGKGL